MDDEDESLPPEHLSSSQPELEPRSRRCLVVEPNVSVIHEGGDSSDEDDDDDDGAQRMSEESDSDGPVLYKDEDSDEDEEDEEPPSMCVSEKKFTSFNLENSHMNMPVQPGCI